MAATSKLLLTLVVWLALVPDTRPQTLTTNTVLILHDSAGQYGWIGGLHARMLANLLGHFQLPYQILGVENYRAGDVNTARATCYIGTLFNNPLPAAFRQDTVSTVKPVCWFKYNLWQVSDAAFEARYGFRFDYFDFSGFDTVHYKNETFSKHPLDSELGLVSILDPTRARAPATACTGTNAHCIPYIVQADNFWYVADSPFSYIGEEDRYLVFCDLLHDILQIAHPESRHALIRIEDIDPTYPPALLRQVADYLHGEGVPFAVSVVPIYNDPFGFYNNGTPESYELSKTPQFVEALEYMVAKGGQLLLHGYTHQYGSVINPLTGVTGDDYEFFRVTFDAQTNIVDFRPVPEDSTQWARGRVNSALREFQKSGLSAVGWVTPHYAASAVDYEVFASKFSLTIQRALYFDDAGRVAGQFFPYVIHQDIYGQKILPENLGNVDPEPWFIYPARFPEDMIRAARKTRVVRDGWASGFFHAFLDISYLQELVTGIKALGYTYVPAVASGPPLITLQPQPQTNLLGARAAFSVAAIGSEPLSYQWRRNGTNISGATQAVLTVTNLQLSQVGNYSVLVSNSAGSMLSSNAMLMVVPPPVTLRISAGANAVNLAFNTETGLMYHVEYKNAFADPSWAPLGSVIGNGATMIVSDSTAARPARFYRVRVE